MRKKINEWYTYISAVTACVIALVIVWLAKHSARGQAMIKEISREQV